MSRETKVGLIVAGSFLCLIAVVVAARMRLDDEPQTATVLPKDPEPVAVAQANNDHKTPQNAPLFPTQPPTATIVPAKASIPTTLPQQVRDTIPSVPPVPDFAPAPIPPAPVPPVDSQQKMVNELTEAAKGLPPPATPIFPGLPESDHTPQPPLAPPAPVTLPTLPDVPAPVTSVPVASVNPAPAAPNPFGSELVSQVPPAPKGLSEVPNNAPQFPSAPPFGGDVVQAPTPPAPTVPPSPPITSVPSFEKNTPVVQAPPPAVINRAPEKAAPSFASVPSNNPPMGAAPSGFTPINNPSSPPLPLVRSMDVAVYTVLPSDVSLAAVSQQHYGNDKYARALERFNEESTHAQAGDLARPQPGTKLLIPPTELLRARFPALIAESTAMPPLGEQPATQLPVRPVQLSPPGTTAKVAAPKTPTTDVTKSYLVRGNSQHIIEIAQQTLHDGHRWTEIYRLNPGLQPAQPIPAGTEVRLPADAVIP